MKPTKKASDDILYIKKALEEAAKCTHEDDRTHPKVGAVAVKDGRILAVAHRGELEPGEHAEFTALEKKLGGKALAGATIYTTLEPCTTRNHPKVPCAHRLIERRVKRVVIGMLDPNDHICGRGLWHLRESGIATDLFPHEYMVMVEELNREFIRQHRPKLRWGAQEEPAGTGLTVPPPATAPESADAKLFSKLFESAEKNDFAKAEDALRELQSRTDDDERKQRLQILFWSLKAKHGSDIEARRELEKIAGNSGVAAFATESLAELQHCSGNVLAATRILGEAESNAPDPKEKALFALKAAEFHTSANEHGLAIAKLRSAAALEIPNATRAQILGSLAEAADGETAGLQKAALLCRACSLEPSRARHFAAAYSLAGAGLASLSAVHYEMALEIAPEDNGSRNNLAVAFERLALPGMAVQHYRQAADGGNTLAMANLAHRYLNAGFFTEAESEIKRGRTAEDPHENIGSAMVALAQVRKDEDKKWTSERRVALGQRKFLDELANAMTTDTSVQALVGPWQIEKTVTASLKVTGSNAETTWEDSGGKRRFRGTIIGRALVGTFEEWNGIYQNRFESKGTLAFVLRDDGSLYGVLVAPDGGLRIVEWGKAG